MEDLAQPTDSRFISHVLRRNWESALYETGHQIALYFSNHYYIQSSEWAFDPQRFAKEGHCVLTPKPEIHTEITTNYQADGLRSSYGQAWFNIEWQGNSLQLLKIRIEHQQVYWLVGKTKEITEAFFKKVCELGSFIRPEQEILLFDAGHWSRNEVLREAIRNATFENLVLAKGMAERIKKDLERFFCSKQQYQRYGLPWRRGLLLTGPPGNGKTHTIKALINTLGVRCLYVRSLEGCGEHSVIRSIFTRARQSTPCVLVLEDLDTLITPENRSIFLNELDGFSDNSGLMIIATTNYPERLDAAITERPGRFDRRYELPLPELHERKTFLQRWNRAMDSVLTLPENTIDQIAEQSSGLSFASLREVITTALLHCLDENGTATELIEHLKAELRSLQKTTK